MNSQKNNTSLHTGVKFNIGISTNLLMRSMTAMSSVEYILKKCDLVEVELEGKFRKYTDNAKNIDSAIQIRTMLGNYINKCATVHAPYIRVDYLNSEVAFKSAYETLTNALTYANALDAKYFTFHPGF